MILHEKQGRDTLTARFDPPECTALPGDDDPTAKKIGILGQAPGSLPEAPFKDNTWDLWTLSNLAMKVVRWNRHFELHHPAHIKATAPEGYVDWLRIDHGRPIFMIEPYPEIPNSIKYPKAAIVDLFGLYFTNSISWMIALAIHEGATHIGLWGVDMALQGIPGKSEYAQQRPSVEYLLGIAVGRGLSIYVHPKSDVLKSHGLYGFDTTDTLGAKHLSRIKELDQRINAAGSKEQSAHDERVYLAGAKTNMEEYLSQGL